jgi:protein-L-isoaspartate(D-aspartate) O-methyltransferase
MSWGMRFVLTFAAVQFLADSSVLVERALGKSPSAAEKSHSKPAVVAKANSPAIKEDIYFKARQKMVRYLGSLGIKNQEVLAAMGRIPRHRFVTADRQKEAYEDAALQIGHEQTISAPHIVALMTELVQPSRTKRALDIGTGSGYQAAVLSALCKEVYSIEIVKPLAEQAKKRLADLDYHNVTVRCGDGYRGWPEKAPFDVIVVAAAPDHVPQPLVDQLAPGGRLVIPVGQDLQKLLLIEKSSNGSIQKHEISMVKFVPMTGEAQNKVKKHS